MAWPHWICTLVYLQVVVAKDCPGCQYYIVSVSDAGNHVVNGENTLADIEPTVDLLRDFDFEPQKAPVACVEFREFSCGPNANCTFSDPDNFYVECSCPAVGFVEDRDDDRYSCDDIDECATSVCHANALCNNTVGSFVCTCKDGYHANGTVCEDTNECDLGPCHHNAKCENFDGGYNCTCLEGFIGDGRFCEANCTCPPNTECLPAPGGFECLCLMGYHEDASGTCIDDDECLDPSACSSDANCTNTDGSFVCECHEGFTGDGINCTESSCDCPPNAECITSTSGFECKCRAGFEENDIGDCIDTDECKDAVACNFYANCTNTEGSFLCKCNEGYTGDGLNCTDIDECSLTPCHAFATCNNLFGSHTCECKDGYAGDGVLCEKYWIVRFAVVISTMVFSEDLKDESSSAYASATSFVEILFTQFFDNLVLRVFSFFDFEFSSGSLVVKFDAKLNANITTKDASEIAAHIEQLIKEGNITALGNHTITVLALAGRAFLIECPDSTPDCEAYLQSRIDLLCGNSTNCTYRNETDADIDECAMSPCHEFANCTNLPGSYACSCIDGYQGNGTHCEESGCDCPPNAECLTSTSGFECKCLAGFVENDIGDCIDIDECKDAVACNFYAICTNTEGSFVCICNGGYSGDGLNCTDINECEELTHDCMPEVGVCSNVQGSYDCACKEGFSGDGRAVCNDIGECTKCSENAVCEDVDGTLSCTCKEGFVGDGYDCVGNPTGLDLKYVDDKLKLWYLRNKGTIRQYGRDFTIKHYAKIFKVPEAALSGVPTFKRLCL